MQKLALIFGLIAVGFLTGCLHELGIGDGYEEPTSVSGTGTIRFIDLEGGFFGILADDGSEYLPLNLPAEFENDGLRVSFEANIAKDVTTIQQWGVPVNITRIETLN